MKTKTLLSLAVIPAVLALAACGSSSNDNSPSTASTTASSTASTTSSAFSTKNVAGVGEILVDAQGNALYTNDQDTTGNVMCTGECTSIWMPLTQNGKPVGLDGKPLYTFAQDSPGKVTGDGARDTFNGVDFVWTVATPSGSSAGTPPAATSTQSDTTSSAPSGGYSGGY